MKEAKKTLELRKLTISKLNNLTVINGGSAPTIAGPSDACVTKLSNTCPPTSGFPTQTHHIC